MATIVTWNASTFTVPATGEENWGGTTKVDGLLISLVQNGFQKSGGLFTLSADVDFGPTAGLKAIYYKSRATSPATTGIVRLGNATTEAIGWRNFANGANYTLGMDGTSSNYLKSTCRIQVNDTAAQLNLKSSTTMASGGTAFVEFQDSDQTQMIFGLNSTTQRARQSFYGGSATVEGIRQWFLSSNGWGGDFWNLDTLNYVGTGNTTSGNTTVSSISSALTAKLTAGMRVWAPQITDKIASIVDGTHFTVVTGGAYATGGGTIYNQDLGTSKTYSAYNAGTKTFTVADTTGWLAADTTYASNGVPIYTRISSVGATSIVLDTAANATLTGVTLYFTDIQHGNITMSTPGTRNGTDNGLLNLYYASSTGSQTDGLIYLHNNDPQHTPNRLCGIVAFNDAPLTARGGGPAGSPIGGLQFVVENDTAGLIGSGNFYAYVANGTLYTTFISSDNVGNVRLGGGGTSNRIAGATYFNYGGTDYALFSTTGTWIFGGTSSYGHLTAFKASSSSTSADGNAVITLLNTNSTANNMSTIRGYNSSGSGGVSASIDFVNVVHSNTVADGSLRFNTYAAGVVHSVTLDKSGNLNLSGGVLTANVTGSASLNVLKAGDTMTGQLANAVASQAAPAYAFTGSAANLSSGMWLASSAVHIGYNNTDGFSVGSAAVTTTVPVVHPVGAVGAPSVTFTGQTTSGVYYAGGAICTSVGGVIGLQVYSASGSVVCGSAASATNATDGFLYIPTCAGAPTGVPTAFTGRVAIIYDTTNNKFYVYNGAWKGGTAPGVWS